MTQKTDVIRQEIGEGECAPSPATDHLSQLDADLQKVVRRAEQKALWEHRPARLRCGDHEIDAYPVRGSGGKVCYTVKSRENGLVIAYGVLGGSQ